MPEKSSVKKKVVKAKVTKPKVLIDVPTFTFPGIEILSEVLNNEQILEVSSYIKKFQNRFAVKLHYIHKFRSFKLFKNVKGKQKQVDWITLNELMKRYDCRIPPLGCNLKPQRPYEGSRVY